MIAPFHFALAACVALAVAWAEPPPPTLTPTPRAVDLSLGESAEVTLANGRSAKVKLLALDERVDSMSAAVREAKVKVEINGETATLTSANYHLPRTIGGVQVDCPITRGYNANSSEDSWGLVKDARLRFWPAGSPWIEPGTFVYPLKQRWFATMTQFSNEPTYVDGGDKPDRKKIYYHNDLDFGGCEALVDVVAATDGLVVSVSEKTLPDYQDTPVRPRYDVVYVLDERGWYYRYSHLHTIDPAIQMGSRVKMGQHLGVLGKEGASGGWSHLHFGIKSRQPSGKWGTQEAYAFAWEAYVRERQPEVIAVARPHHFIRAGDTITLDASKSWAASGKVASYEWTFTDGRKATGAQQERRYVKPGAYSEIVKVTDEAGHTGYDFAIVQVMGSDEKNLPPAIHPSFAPTTNLKPGDAITFKVRTFRDHGGETWNFGDGTPTVSVQSDGNAKALAKDGYAVTQHRFAQPGDYIVMVETPTTAGNAPSLICGSGSGPDRCCQTSAQPAPFMKRITRISLLGYALTVLVRAVEPQPLPGTQPLGLTGDLSAPMHEAALREMDKKIADTPRTRAQFWHRAASSPEEYTHSIKPNRSRFQRIIGLVDERVPVTMERFGDDANPALVAETQKVRISQVRWPVFADVHGEGLLIEPRDRCAPAAM